MIVKNGSGRRVGNASTERGIQHGLRVGMAKAIAHHGELLQGVFEGGDGRLHRGLLTLPFPHQHTQASLWPSDEADIRTRPADRHKARRAVGLTLEHLGITSVAADLTLESTISMGHGYGSSTADVVSAIKAAAMAAHARLRRSTINRLAVAAESASDAIVYEDRPVLFAQREGFVLEHFGDEFPPLLVVGFRDPAAGAVETLTLQRARYDMEEIQLFRALRGLAGRSVRHQDPRLLGRVATVSACISQRHLPKPGWERAAELARRFGACGLQVAHSGSLLGILLDGEAPQLRAQASELVREARQAGFEDIQTFVLNMERDVLE